ncbi:hypothetical protein PPACK8108_LOCUS5769 [Phakopsora pachyrhizi]|uniref:Uncharacterized protein n=1 Tax=Phakopsora pachyrhizi TaxID=170000 RepID=A0AAV0ATM5_PHAPC|nr:hypothetical protein PPACK8108_LOCUS5769 [Phakopsora pachyrhizi]
MHLEKTSTLRDMSRFEVEDAIAAHKKHWKEHERQKAKKAPLPSVPIVNPGTSKSYNLRTRSQNPPNPIQNSPFNTRGNSSTRKSFQKIKYSPSKPHQELKDLYQSPYIKDGLFASTSYQTSGKKADEQDQKSKFGLERTSASLSEYAASSSKEDISRLEELRKEHEKASKLKVLRSLKKEAEDEMFDLLSRKTSISRRTSVAGSPLPTRIPSISAGSIKPRTENEELMRYIPQLLQRLIEKIDNPPKDCDFGGILKTELIRKHFSAELKKKKDKKLYEMIEGRRNIDEYIRNNQAEKSVGLTYQSRYEKAKKESSSTGFGLTEDDQSKGGDPKQLTWALPQTTNESTDEDMPSNTGEATLTSLFDDQLFSFPKEDEDIKEGEDINQPATNSNIITNDIPKTSKSAQPPTTYAELYEAKTDCE